MTTAPIEPLLSDRVHWEELENEGYTRIPILPPSALARMQRAFADFHPVLAGGTFMSSTYSGDLSYKQAVSRTIVEIAGPHLERWFHRHRVLGGAFLYKMPGPQSGLPLHQDWTVVDETRYLAANVWIPLVDADCVNGTLHVMPGSHRVMRGIRAPTIPFCYSGHDDLMHRNMVALPTRAGEAVIVNQATVHYSPANLSESVRPAVTIGVVSADSPLRFYYRDKLRDEPCLEVFEQEDDFFLRFDNFHQDIFRRPTTGRPLGEVPYVDPVRTAVELEAMIDECRRLSASRAGA